ncbi:hypothetical protein [Paracoccus sp. (in: a-proteobacteria)]|uniref:hypothetical protein n=1 Tax=Paracoccus sp. TaxID=267 RepID=UPI0035B06825
MYLKQGLVALLALGPVSAAWALPATDEGATRLKGVFQTYFGGVDGVVTVTPKGETYDLVIDPAPLLAQIPGDSGLKVEIGALTYQLTDNGDGSWGVTENQTLSMSISVPGVMDQIASTKIESSGIWDEALPGFREQKSVMTGYTVNSTQYMPAGLPQGLQPNDAAPEAAPDAPTAQPQVMSRDSSSTDRFETNLTAKAAAAGGVDHEITYRAEGLNQTMDYADMGGMGPMHFEMTSPGYDGTAKIMGARNDGILGLTAWLVAHPSQELIAGSQDGLRDKLSAAMPLWDDITADMVLRDLKVVTPFGEFGAAEVGGEFGLSGVEGEGRFREMVNITGLTVPEAIIPPWALPVVPQEVSFDFTASDFNLAAPAKMIIEGFDLTLMDPMVNVDPDALQTAFFAGSPVALALAPSHIKGDGYEIGYEGAMQAGPDAPPSGSAKITASGLDKIEAALNAAPPEQAQQPLMMLQMAKMLGKAGASGELVWEIDATDPNGAILVNGQQVAGGTPPQQ